LVLSRRSKFKSNKINTSAIRGYAGWVAFI
jgi:hypothetical protein